MKINPNPEPEGMDAVIHCAVTIQPFIEANDLDYFAA